MWGERGNDDGSTPLHVTQQHHLASMAAWLSFIVISHHNLLPHIPLISLSAVNSSPRPGITPQSLNSSSHPLCLWWTCVPVWDTDMSCHSCRKTVWFSFHLGCHRSALSLSALNVSPLTQTVAPLWGSDPLLQFPHLPRAGPVLLTLPCFPLVPSSYRVLRGSIRSFPLVRSSCPLSDGGLHALLCLKVYSWYIPGERCQPSPPFCSPPNLYFFNALHLWCLLLQEQQKIHT